MTDPDPIDQFRNFVFSRHRPRHLNEIQGMVTYILYMVTFITTDEDPILG